MKLRIEALAIASLVLLAATQSGDPAPAPRRSLPERVPEPETAPVTGEVPQQVLDAVRADLGMRTGAEPGAMKVVQAMEIVFSDGSLGCGRPGQRYTQETVPGYHVILALEGKEYDYRVSRRGALLLCKQDPRPR